MKINPLVDAESLRHLLARRVPDDAGSLAIIDCRFDLGKPAAGFQAYLEGHIPGAGYADLNRDLSGPITPTSGRHPLPSPAIFSAWASEVGISNHTQVIAYDAANGSFAARLWWLLRWLGHDAVAVLDGGFAAWKALGGAVEVGAPPSAKTPTRRPFVAHADRQLWLTTEQVQQALGQPGRVLVDARAPQRFSGHEEPLDAVAGHIPQALNHPFTLNLTKDGRFLPGEELRRLWQQRLAGIAPADLIAMCGSGVTACNNLLALEVAGLKGGRLYPGSWSEWIRDPRRPVAIEPVATDPMAG